MKIRGNKGITLISLTVTVILLLAITGAIIYNSRNQIASRRINDLKLDIELLNAKVDDYFLRNGELPVLCYYTDKVNFAEILNKVAASQHSGFNEELNANDGDEYVVIDIEKLGGITLNYGYEPDGDYSKLRDGRVANADTATDIELYVINTTSHQIYFPHGVFADNIMYYTLNSDKYHVNADLASLDTRAEIEVGDYITYVPPERDAYSLTSLASGNTSNQTLSQKYNIWRVLNINSDGTIDIMPAFNKAELPSVTTSYGAISFGEAKGWNNAPYLLNDMCKTLYEVTNTNPKKAITARSIDYEDIMSYMTEGREGTTSNDSIGKKKISKWQSEQIAKLTIDGNYITEIQGDIVSYKQLRRYPILYPYVRDELSSVYYTNSTFDSNSTSKAWSNEGDHIEMSCSIYAGTIDVTDFKNDVIYDVIFGSNHSYWLASRCCFTAEHRAEFAVRFVECSNNKRIVCKCAVCFEWI